MFKLKLQVNLKYIYLEAIEIAVNRTQRIVKYAHSLKIHGERKEEINE